MDRAGYALPPSPETPCMRLFPRQSRALLTSAALTLLACGARAQADDAPAPAPAPAHAETGVAFEPAGAKWADVVAKAEKDAKPIFIDFFTDWCGWCKKLDKDVFSQASVAEVMKAMVAVHADAEDKGEYQELAKKYGAHGYPTMVVVTAKGEEVDRIVGYMPPAGFTKEIARILSGEGTLPALKKEVAAKPDDLGLALKLGMKLLDSDAVQGNKLLEDVLAKAEGKDRGMQAKALGAMAQAAAQSGNMEKALPLLERVAGEFADTEGAGESVGMLLMFKLGRQRDDFDGALAYAAGLRKKTKDGKLPAAAERMIAQIHTAAAGQALERAGAGEEDPQVLNELAWTAYSQHIAMRKAVEWATKAAEKSQRDPMILDTLANLLFETGKVEEAVKTELEAMEKVEALAQKAVFAETLAKFKAVIEARQRAAKAGHESVPATPTVPAPEKKPEPAKPAGDPK